MKSRSIPQKANLLLLLFFFVLNINLLGQESGVKIEVKQIDGYMAMVMKADVPTAQVGEKMGEMFGKLTSYIDNHKIELAGPPFAVYYSYDPSGNTMFELGYPVTSKMEGNNEIMFKEYPSTKAVTAMYKGSYDKMEPVYTALEKYITDNNLEKEGTSCEVYYTDPNEVAPEENQTLIYYPVKD